VSLRAFPLAAAIGWLVALVTPGHAEEVPHWVDTARGSAKSLAVTLLPELQRALREGGSAHAVGFCKLQAPELTGRLSSPRLVVERRALRWRNPANAPDDWERRTMESFQQAIERGEDPARLEAWTEVSAAEGRTGRWMKPIMTQPLCLQCHGNRLEPAVVEALQRDYPEDRATGFAAGQMRGAFSVRVVAIDDPAWLAEDRP
jgi:hypothetical protein